MKVEQRTIDGVGYTCTQMPGMRSVRVSARLIKYLGEPVVRMLAGATQWKAGTTAADIMMSLADICPNVEEDMVVMSIGDLFKGCLTADNIVGQEVAGDVWEHFDMHFAGRMMHLYKVVRFAMEVNFHDFFDVFPSMTGGEILEEDTRE